MKSNSSPGESPPTPRLIHLMCNAAGNIKVVPPRSKHRSRPRAKPFYLPRLPLSQHCWLTALTAEFYRRHQRCLAVLLVLELTQRRWLAPVIPAQACGAEGSCWSLDLGPEFKPWPADRCIAGSFQSRRGADTVHEASASVPQVDGLHLVQNLFTETQQTLYGFVRAGGRTIPIHAGDASIDDWREALKEASERMRFE